MVVSQNGGARNAIMGIRNGISSLYISLVVLSVISNEVMALSDSGLKATIGVTAACGLIIIVVAIIFIIRYYKKLKETRKAQKKKDAQEMIMMRQKYGEKGVGSASLASGIRTPEILVNGQVDPEISHLGKADWTWGPDNGHVKRPTPALPGSKPIQTGVAKKVSKKKGIKAQQSPPKQTSLFAKHNGTAPPFEDQTMSLDMVSEVGDIDDRDSIHSDNSESNGASEPKSPLSDREAFMMDTLQDEIGMDRDGAELDLEKGVTRGTQMEDFVGQVNEDEITGEVDPTNTIPSEVYYSERLYNRIEKPTVETPKVAMLPETEVVLELVEMKDFSANVHASEILEECGSITEKEGSRFVDVQPKDESTEPVNEKLDLTYESIEWETETSQVRQQINPLPPPVPATTSQPIRPTNLEVYQQQQRLTTEQQRSDMQKSMKSNKSVKSNKSNKSDKSKKSNKSNKSKKMVKKRKVNTSDFLGQCFEDDIAKETGVRQSPNNDIYAMISKPQVPPIVPSKTFKDETPPVQVVKADITIPPKEQDAENPYDQSGDMQEDDTGELTIPNLALFDRDEDALRHHHVRLKKPSESHSPYNERHESIPDDYNTHDAERVNAMFASIFQEHPRGLTSDSSEDELDKPRTPRSPGLSDDVFTVEKQKKDYVRRTILTNDSSEHRHHTPHNSPAGMPVFTYPDLAGGRRLPGPNNIGPTVERDRLRHDESLHVDTSGKKTTTGDRDINKSYENNWGKLTDETIAP